MNSGSVQRIFTTTRKNRYHEKQAANGPSSGVWPPGEFVLAEKYTLRRKAAPAAFSIFTCLLAIFLIS